MQINNVNIGKTSSLFSGSTFGPLASIREEQEEEMDTIEIQNKDDTIPLWHDEILVRNRSTKNEDAAEIGEPPVPLDQLINDIRKDQLCPVNDTKNKDFEALQRRVNDFERARWMRHDRGSGRPAIGILKHFDHLVGIRADLKWAEFAEYRRNQNLSYVGWTDYIKEYEQNCQRNPYFLIAMLLICTLMLFYSMYLGGWEIVSLSDNPMVGPSPETLVEAGALQSPLVIVDGEWYRLFTATVLHAGIVHYVTNMLALWFIGAPFERAHGPFITSYLFILAAVGGNVFRVTLQPNVTSVGASGGIYGLVGGSLADIFINWDLLSRGRTQCSSSFIFFWLIFEVALNAAIGLTPVLDNFSHMGGLFYGFFGALPLVNKMGLHFFGRRSVSHRAKTYSLRILGFLVGVNLMVVAYILLAWSDGYHSPYKRCRFLSCAPFPFWKDEKWWDCSIPS